MYRSFFYKSVTLYYLLVLIWVKAFKQERKEMKALEDSMIVELYLRRDEAAVRETAEKYGSKLRALA